MITVDINGKGDYKCIADAIKNAEENTEIYVKNGVYREKLVLDTPNIKITGEEKENTVIIYGDGAKKLDENGDEIGTFKTATFEVTKNATGFKMENITVVNDAGMGDIAGQAVALYLDCDMATVKNCMMKARQDTLLTAPMHIDIENNPEIKNRQYFENCYIEGDVDFIFGGAVAIFNKCEICSLDRNKKINGYITAPCTAKGLKYGYVFIDCKLTGNMKEGTVFLGRPWREYANTVFIGCEMGKHIHKEGFSIWNGTDRHKNCYSAVYNVKGDYDTSGLIEWAHILSDEEAKQYSMENVFEGWMP